MFGIMPIMIGISIFFLLRQPFMIGNIVLRGCIFVRLNAGHIGPLILWLPFRVWRVSHKNGCLLQPATSKQTHTQGQPGDCFVLGLPARFSLVSSDLFFLHFSGFAEWQARALGANLEPPHCLAPRAKTEAEQLTERGNQFGFEARRLLPPSPFNSPFYPADATWLSAVRFIIWLADFFFFFFVGRSGLVRNS